MEGQYNINILMLFVDNYYLLVYTIIMALVNYVFGKKLLSTETPSTPLNNILSAL